MKYLRTYIGKRSRIRLFWHACKAFLAALYYRFPARSLTVVCITGTDGKTTTVAMLAHILESHNIKAGALSTAFFKIQSQTSWNTTEKTSPSPFVIQKFLRTLVRNNCTHAILETSSHGLVQHRLDYTWPQYRAITNIAEEHLDYHETMQQYIRDKGILFRIQRPSGTHILHKDDQTFPIYSQYSCAKMITYSTTGIDADVRLQSVSVTPQGTVGSIAWNNQSAECTLPILGEFNQHNALCALSTAYALGISPEQSTQYLRTFPPVPARLETVHVGQPYTVVIDFTVTPQAFTATLQTLEKIKQSSSRLYIVTGACGDRMREKRPIIGEICANKADVLVITDDEPYTEDPAKIRKEILVGTQNKKAIVHEIADRTEAITFCMQNAKPSDIVLLAGLGSYPSRMFHDGPRPWDEKQVAIDAIVQSMSS